MGAAYIKTGEGFAGNKDRFLLLTLIGTSKNPDNFDTG